MYKKAGIIVGGLIIVVAVVIFIIASNANKTEDTQSDIPVATQTTQSTQGTPAQTQTPVVAPVETVQTTQATQSTQPVETQPVETQQTQPAQTEVAPPVVDSTAFVKIDPASLPAYTDETDLGTVVGHNVYSYNHQVIYSILINTTTHGQIEWFTDLVDYNTAVGTKLECTIRTFNAAQTGAFPSIISVTAI